MVATLATRSRLTSLLCCKLHSFVISSRLQAKRFDEECSRCSIEMTQLVFPHECLQMFALRIPGNRSNANHPKRVQIHLKRREYSLLAIWQNIHTRLVSGCLFLVFCFSAACDLTMFAQRTYIRNSQYVHSGAYRQVEIRNSCSHWI